jgi:hypothetical protein
MTGPAPDTELTEPIPRRDGMCGATHPHLYPENTCRGLAGHEGQHMAHDSQGRPEYVWTSGGEWDWAPDPAPYLAPDTDLTERLTAALYDSELVHRCFVDKIAALLPVVQEYGAEQAAEALEEARWAVHVERFNADDEPDARWPRGAKQAVPTFYAGIVRAEAVLRDRAATLRTDTDRSTR